jgi:excisionase family DNA binding protein
MDPISNKKYLTVHEVAVMLGVKDKTVYYWTQEKRLTSYKFGRLVRIDPDDVARLIEKSRREPDPGPAVTA